MAQIERHFFVENARPVGAKPSCGARGSGEIATALQEGLGRHPELWGRVAVTSTGCLGPCFEGPTIVVYPEAVWYVGVTPADVPEIVEQHMSGGRPVERLRRQDQETEDDVGPGPSTGASRGEPWLRSPRRSRRSPTRSSPRPRSALDPFAERLVTRCPPKEGVRIEQECAGCHHPSPVQPGGNGSKKAAPSSMDSFSVPDSRFGRRPESATRRAYGWPLLEMTISSPA